MLGILPFLRHIATSPDDPRARQVLSDWLEERGREDLSKYARSVCELMGYDFETCLYLPQYLEMNSTWQAERGLLETPHNNIRCSSSDLVTNRFWVRGGVSRGTRDWIVLLQHRGYTLISRGAVLVSQNKQREQIELHFGGGTRSWVDRQPLGIPQRVLELDHIARMTDSLGQKATKSRRDARICRALWWPPDLAFLKRLARG
jgi:uncharacterized protein (TIGR02996 family)